VAGLISETWYGILGPSGIPADRQEILARAARAALEDAETRRLVTEQGGRVVGGTPAEFAEYIRSTHASWGEVVRATGVRLE
jgi:tripartite-type tricarboxylate transporter receptor subunit TctC